MPYNPDVHHRRSTRLRGYDYRQDGMYFVTICTHQRDCLSGKVVDGEMMLSSIGKIVQQTWDDLPSRFPSIALNWFVVMPNHVHGVLFLGADPAVSFDDAGGLGARCIAPSPGPPASRSSRVLPALGEVVRAFKAVSTYHVRAACMPGFAWQRNYYDHIIRTDADLHRFRAYIDANPANWAQDEENPIRHS